MIQSMTEQLDFNPGTALEDGGTSGAVRLE
jgi:hypothetical protein